MKKSLLKTVNCKRRTIACSYTLVSMSKRGGEGGEEGIYFLVENIHHAYAFQSYCL